MLCVPRSDSEDKASVNGCADSSYGHRLLGGIANSSISCLDEYGISPSVPFDSFWFCEREWNTFELAWINTFGLVASGVREDEWKI
jgi:hypothetical protein